MNTAVLDTDTLSAIMRQDDGVVSNAKRYLASRSKLNISIITRYEILRGLMAKNATAQIAKFDTLCGTIEVLQLTDPIVVRAAAVYAHLRQIGKPIGDADILIAATCLEHGHQIVTNNTSHFSRIPGLVVQNWLAK